MKINSLVKNDVSDIYSNQGFRRMLEGYMNYFRNSVNTTPLPLDSHSVYKYEGDLYGLLSSVRVPAHLHWLVMRINNIDSPLDVKDDLTALLIPDTSDINKLALLFRSSSQNSVS